MSSQPSYAAFNEDRIALTRGNDNHAATRFFIRRYLRTRDRNPRAIARPRATRENEEGAAASERLFRRVTIRPTKTWSLHNSVAMERTYASRDLLFLPSPFFSPFNIPALSLFLLLF